METVTTIILAFGSIGTLIAAGLVYRTLKSNHDWQRREYALNILRGWNEHTSKHWQAIESVYPHLRDIDRTGGKVTELTKHQAKDIYTCEPDDKDCWDLRYHIVELLNHLEYVAMSYNHKVADQKIVKECLRDAMIKYYHILKNMVDVVEICEGYLPWIPYTELVNAWESEHRTNRKATA